MAAGVTVTAVTTSAQAEGHWDVRAHVEQTAMDREAGSDHEVSNATARASCCWLRIRPIVIGPPHRGHVHVRDGDTVA